MRMVLRVLILVFLGRAMFKGNTYPPYSPISPYQPTVVPKPAGLNNVVWPQYMPPDVAPAGFEWVLRPVGRAPVGTPVVDNPKKDMLNDPAE